MIFRYLESETLWVRCKVRNPDFAWNPHEARCFCPLFISHFAMYTVSAVIVQIESFSLSLPPSLTTACTDCSSLSLTSCYVPTDAVVQLWSGGHCLCLSCTPATNQKRNKWRHYSFTQNLCRRLAIFWSNYQHPRLGHCTGHNYSHYYEEPNSNIGQVWQFDTLFQYEFFC